MSLGFFFPSLLSMAMERTTLLAIGLFVFAWLTMIYQSCKEGWNRRRSAGMFMFLVGATSGVFLDNLLPAKSPLFPWIEPVAAVIMLIGLFIEWI